MNFLYPLGLLGLIGIPILIIIYIIKSKYTEQTVASTYLWRLSEKFLKRRNPLNPLAGMISLILQILAVTVLSLAIAHPVFVIPGAANEYCFILDGSASMNMQSGDGVRFDDAKMRVSEMIEDAAEGSVFTLIYVGDTTAKVYERISDEDRALELLEGIKPCFSADDYTEAFSMAQEMFGENSSMKTYLITDKSYTAENVETVKVGDGTSNVGIFKPVHSLNDGVLTVSAELVSYSGDTTVTVELYVNGSTEPAAEMSVSLAEGEKTLVSFSETAPSFSSAVLRIKESDGFMFDNSLTVLDLKGENSYSVLLVSDQPFFVNAALSAIGCNDVTVISTEDYDGAGGYGLYVFESYVPEALPRDGSVWFINPKGSVPDSGFSVQGETVLEAHDVLELTKASSTLATKLTEGVTGEGIYVKQYVKCGLYKNFTTLLSYKGNPVVFAGTNNYGNRQAVLALDLHASNLPLLADDYLTLTENLFEYAFPYIVDEVQYCVGDVMNVNVPAGAQIIEVKSPSGESAYLNTDSAIAEHKLTEVGDYSVTVTVGSVKRQLNVHSAVPESERATEVSETGAGLLGEAGSAGRDGEYDPMVLLFIILAVIFAADWMVYCYEKYQLR